MSPASISTQSQLGRPSTRALPWPPILQRPQQVVGDGADVTVRAARCDDQAVGDGALVGKVDEDDVLRLFVVQAGKDHRLERLRLARVVGGRVVSR